jgi:2-alkyl-3-oxoalkanoate reductase
MVSFRERAGAVARICMHATSRLSSTFNKEPLLTCYSAAILARTQTYDVRAAKRDLGFAPYVSVANGTERTLEALEEHR